MCIRDSPRSLGRSAKTHLISRERDLPTDATLAMDGAAHGGDHIQVLVRVRPPNARELSQGYVKALRANPGGASLDVLHPAHAAAKTTSAHSYGYDHVCDEHQTQAEVFESVGVPVTDAFLEGYHGCLIAYGQTGAGKTYTCLLYTSPSPRDLSTSRMPSSA